MDILECTPSLNKYYFLFDGTLGTCKIKPVDIELKPDANPYDLNPYLMTRDRESTSK